jgi:hypothetical protein
MRPAESQSTFKSAMTKTKFAFPLRDCSRHAEIRDLVTSTRVIGLLCVGLPLAIARLVIAVIIEPSKGIVASRTRPHVGEECQEVSSPFVAHDNAPAAIVLVRRIADVVATCFSAAPRFVFSSATQTMCTATLCNQPTLQTAAALASTITKVCAKNVARSATFTSTLPLAARWPRSRLHDEQAEFLSTKIDEMCHVGTLPLTEVLS